MNIKYLIVFLLCVFISGCANSELFIAENMVLVEGGEFLLGKEGETSHLVKVRLDDYYISKYETTVEQWEVFLDETGTPYQWKDEYTDMRVESPYPDSPIGVHWIQAIKYANWVSRRYGLKSAIQSKVQRLNGKEMPMGIVFLQMLNGSLPLAEEIFPRDINTLAAMISML